MLNNILANYYFTNDYKIRWQALEDNINSLLSINQNEVYIKNNVWLENINVPMLRKVHVTSLGNKTYSFYNGFDITDDKYTFIFTKNVNDNCITKVDTLPELVKIIIDNI